jgi:HAD superfamily hydrolase (TIGR01490 family)
MSEAAVVRSRPRVGAFFDMDKTLIAENSGTLLMKHRYELGEIGNLDLLKGVAVYLQYKLGVLDIRSWAQSVLAEYRGKREDEIEKQAREWFDQKVASALYPEAEQLVRGHAAAGHVVAIVSGATKFIVRPLAERLGIPHMLYTRLEVEGGRFTGRVIDPICFEEGKIYWIQQLIEEEGIDLAKSYFYTDSITDRPLLDLVAHPIAVNPDPMLYREAVRRSWPVRFFTPPDRRSL